LLISTRPLHSEFRQKISDHYTDISDAAVRELLSRFFLSSFSDPEYYSFTFTNEEIYLDFIAEKRVFYAELPQRLTKHQFSTTKAIASLGKVEGVTTSEFMFKSEISSPGTMQAVVKALLEKQVIIREGKSYRLYDVFLEHYLKYFS
jgi:hypothetical protein